VFGKKKKLEFAQPGERRRKEESESEALTLSRRTFVMRGLVGLSFAGLSGQLWRMQIARGDRFRGTASDNITRFERLNAPRGRILDRNGEPLAESRRSWTVSLLGIRLPRDPDERDAVIETLARTLDLKSMLVLDRALVPVGSEAAVVNELTARLEGLDRETLVARLLRVDANVEKLKDGLTPEEADGLRASLADVPGVRVMTEIEYALAKHGSPEVPMPVKKDVDREQALSIAANLMYLPGVMVDDNTLMRQYPGGPAFSHILGYVGPISEEEYDEAKDPGGTPIYNNNDMVGRGGVEQALEVELRGAKGGRWIQVDAQGVERYELLDRRREPDPGLTAVLTIDKAFQQVVHDELQAGINFAHAEALKLGRKEVGAGVAIAMNPQNGEILATVSLPTFDNSKFIGGISEEDWAFYQDPKNFEPLLDRATGGVFPPGSTLKPLIACAGLQEGNITPEKKYLCKGSIRVPHTWDETQGNTYPCWIYDVGHGEVDLYRGIAESCDVYFFNVGAPKQKVDVGPNQIETHYYIPGDPAAHFFEGLGIEKIERYLREAFGFGIPSGIELAGEAEGLVPNPKWLFQTVEEYWSIGDTINVSIGQGHLLCTPLQLLNGTARIANRGTLYQPRLIKALHHEDGSVVREFEPQVLQPPKMAGSDRLATIDQQHLDAVREGMRRTALPKGTAEKVITFSDPVIGSKSGTAEFGEIDEKTGRYKDGHAWFTAFAPFDNPRIAVVVLIVGGHEGSTYAGPVANRILDRFFHELGR
jgi:penicillin-binding protein 2